VTKNIPAYAIAAGNPASVVRNRFDTKTIQHLLKIKWWGWEDDQIQQFLPLMLDSNIDIFLKKASLNKVNRHINNDINHP